MLRRFVAMPLREKALLAKAWALLFAVRIFGLCLPRGFSTLDGAPQRQYDKEHSTSAHAGGGGWKISDTDLEQLELIGKDGGFRYSTKQPKTLWTYPRGEEQTWAATDLGFATPFRTITGGIFEPGFPDLLQQMWAAFLAERAGVLGDRFGCATPDEAVAQHELWTAALAAHDRRTEITLPP